MLKVKDKVMQILNLTPEPPDIDVCGGNQICEFFKQLMEYYGLSDYITGDLKPQVFLLIGICTAINLVVFFWAYGKWRSFKETESFRRQKMQADMEKCLRESRKKFGQTLTKPNDKRYSRDPELKIEPETGPTPDFEEDSGVIGDTEFTDSGKELTDNECINEKGDMQLRKQKSFNFGHTHTELESESGDSEAMKRVKSLPVLSPKGGQHRRFNSRIPVPTRPTTPMRKARAWVPK
ncbi:hypothetical protein KR009_011912 [Drosophila setifemur]|nr:hypothetical protein KR009_011912 [Drosophila setifemur]